MVIWGDPLPASSHNIGRNQISRSGAGKSEKDSRGDGQCGGGGLGCGEQVLPWIEQWVRYSHSQASLGGVAGSICCINEVLRGG